MVYWSCRVGKLVRETSIFTCGEIFSYKNKTFNKTMEDDMKKDLTYISEELHDIQTSLIEDSKFRIEAHGDNREILREVIDAIKDVREKLGDLDGGHNINTYSLKKTIESSISEIKKEIGYSSSKERIERIEYIVSAINETAGFILGILIIIGIIQIITLVHNW